MQPDKDTDMMCFLPSDAVGAPAGAGKFSMAILQERATKENVVMAGGATIAADGIRRAIQRDDEGQRHVVRGVVQTVVGVGMFAAALANRRERVDIQALQR
jgi:hypothetical protein